MTTNVRDLRKWKSEGTRFTMLTCYDYSTARWLDRAGIPVLLVGDSLGTTMLGYPDTLSVTMDDMIRHAGSVVRGAPGALVIGDMPFMAYHASAEDAIRNAGRFLQEARVAAVKMEGGGRVIDYTKQLTAMGIPVMGHLGLTPTFVNQFGGYRVQGRSDEAAEQILADARALEDAGAFAVVLEAIPSALGQRVTQVLSVPRTCVAAPSPPLSTSTPPAKAAVIESANAMQEQAVAWRHAGDDIGVVPTMGALHGGHDSLVARARRENQRVIVTVFVNPAQFGPNEDFARYPRPFDQDRARLEALGVDAIFHPPVDQIYPPAFKTRVDPGPLAEVLEGKSRPGHFAGVLTVVLKLINLTQPKRAYFGQKDFQQVVLVRQLVRDFGLPVRIVAVPTVRHPDGLAMSSRNAYLDDGQRQLAPAVHRAITEAARAFTAGETDPLRLEGVTRERLAATQGLSVDYVAVVDDTTLSRPRRAIPGSVLAVAVKLGSIRLIDNVVLGAERL